MQHYTVPSVKVKRASSVEHPHPWDPIVVLSFKGILGHVALLHFNEMKTHFYRMSSRRC